MTSSLFFPSPSYSLLLHPLSRTEGSSQFSLKPIINFFQRSSPHCLLIAYLTISSSALTLNLRFLSSTSSFTLSQLKIHLKTLLTTLPPCILLMVFQSPSHQPYIIHQPSVWFSCQDEPTTAIYAEQYRLFVFLCSPICLSICSPLFHTPILSS